MEAVRLAPRTDARPDLDYETPDWYDQGRCLDADPVMFFSGGKGDMPALEAVKVCRGCPVVEECLTLAVADPDYDFGVWGGHHPERTPAPQGRTSSVLTYFHGLQRGIRDHHRRGSTSVFSSGMCAGIPRFHRA